MQEEGGKEPEEEEETEKDGLTGLTGLTDCFCADSEPLQASRPVPSTPLAPFRPGTTGPGSERP